jgi:hypothetical protein
MAKEQRAGITARGATHGLLIRPIRLGRNGAEHRRGRADDREPGAHPRSAGATARQQADAQGAVRAGRGISAGQNTASGSRFSMPPGAFSAIAAPGATSPRRSARTPTASSLKSDRPNRCAAPARRCLQAALIPTKVVSGEWGNQIDDALGAMLRRMKRVRLGAWLGFAALAVQAFLPIHLVFDIVEAGADAGIESTRPHLHQYSVFEALAGSQSGDEPSQQPAHGHDAHCPISLAQLHAAAAFTLPAAAALHCPNIEYLAVARVLESHELASSSPASYASRGPPRPSIG